MNRNDSSGHWMSGLWKTGSHNTEREIETKVVGVTYENRQAVIRRMTPGEWVWLRREPANPHDHNAIRVERQDGAQIGYISRVEAAGLAHALDQYGKPVPAIVTAITGGTYLDSNLGVRIKFVIPQADGQEKPTMPDAEDIDSELF